jgi:hypothetical protein
VAPGQEGSKNQILEEAGACTDHVKGLEVVAEQGVGSDSGTQVIYVPVSLSEEDGAGVHEGKVHCEDITEGFSDVGLLNSEEENELEEYIKVIEEEDKVAEEREDGAGVPNGAALAAISEASPKMSGAR